MTAQLNFDLDVPEDVQRYNRCNKSLELVLCLFNLKEQIFNSELITDEVFFETLQSYNINLEELTS